MSPFKSDAQPHLKLVKLKETETAFCDGCSHVFETGEWFVDGIFSGSLVSEGRSLCRECIIKAYEAFQKIPLEDK